MRLYPHMFFRRGRLVIHSHFDRTIKRGSSLFYCISDMMVLSKMHGKGAAMDGGELRKRHVQPAHGSDGAP